MTASLFGAIMLLTSTVLIPLSMATRSLRRDIADRIAWVGFFFMGAFSSFLVMTLLRDVFLLFAGPFTDDDQQFARLSALAAIVSALLMTFIGLINARRRARVVDTEIPIANLPEALHGFSIVQISDVHVGATIKRDYV